ncbi:hypothetical protein CHS0354_041031 [Potamilus streckersoni]|uniref:Uncharacterized protein n=1 Tax=Potamilus streckersoni TaxID=2493646 RepID=A0AAE0W2M4_9BIVA|nr:hypothetical protein CHS0354_041031 [Potamilus streckersoni]
MAALSMGNFGAYKLAYSRYLEEQERQHEENIKSQTVWVTKRYIPTDLRLTAPVPRHKLVARGLPPPDPNWIPVGEPPLRSFVREPERRIFSSHPSTRCEHYSTLRQMLPSKGSIWKPHPSNWGTADTFPSLYRDQPPKRFPLVNSPMTRYVDDMHLTNRLFRLH